MSHSIAFTKSRLISAILLLVTTLIDSHVFADGSAQAIQRAEKFLSSRSTGEFALGLLHLGATYNGHKLTARRNVVDQFGKIIPGEFALVYHFDWDAAGAGVTNVAFLCDSSGNFESLQVIDSTGIFQTPFQIANGTIQLFGIAFIEATKDQMSSESIANFRRIIQSSDSKRFLELSLVLRQSTSR